MTCAKKESTLTQAFKFAAAFTSGALGGTLNEGYDAATYVAQKAKGLTKAL